MTDEELCKDARSAAKCLKDTGTFPTGQGIFLDCADRIEALTAELAKAVEALREIAGECGCSTARAIIAEIEGEKT